MEIGAAVHRSVPQPQARLCSSGSEGYSRRRPEFTALYAVVRDNLETLYGAISNGALDVRVPKHARRELEAYLGCGIPCWRGFARFRCRDCGESRIVAFSCKGRGFCPSCLGRRMCSTAANLMEYVLPPESGLRQWVLTFPFAWRPTLARNGVLLGSLTRIFEATVHGFYAHRARQEGLAGLLDHRQGGNAAKLKPLQLEALQALLQRYTPAQLFGQANCCGDGVFWTVPDLQRLVQERFSVIYRSRTSYRSLFAKCGLSRQRPGQYYKSRNERKVMAFEEELEKN